MKLLWTLKDTPYWLGCTIGTESEYYSHYIIILAIQPLYF